MRCWVASSSARADKRTTPHATRHSQRTLKSPCNRSMCAKKKKQLYQPTVLTGQKKAGGCNPRKTAAARGRNVLTTKHDIKYNNTPLPPSMSFTSSPSTQGGVNANDLNASSTDSANLEIQRHCVEPPRKDLWLRQSRSMLLSRICAVAFAGRLDCTAPLDPKP